MLMEKLMTTALLLTALMAPIVLFCLLKARSRLADRPAAVIAVATGWALNLAWATAANESIAIAGAFGWLCPAVLVLLTWLVRRYMKRRGA